MKRFIAVDSGKFATKVAEFIKTDDKVRHFSIRTKVSEGYLIDDAIEENTVVIEVDGKVYKVGNGARGNGANLDTDKNDDIHRICTLTALATVASANEKDEFYVAVGLPASEWAMPVKREEYKKNMLPEGDVTIKIKKNKGDVVTKTFSIKQRFAFPESIGALFMDGVIEDVIGNPNMPTGVIDIGNLNMNATFWQGTELIQDKSASPELGGAILIQEISEQLSTRFDYVDEMVVANIIKSNPKDRHLPEGLGFSEEEVEQSRQIIDNVIKAHVKKIRDTLKKKNWSIKGTRIVAIGGTSKDIELELKEALGSNLTVLPSSNLCNAYGYLRIMCSKIDEINSFIDLPQLKEENVTVITPSAEKKAS